MSKTQDSFDEEVTKAAMIAASGLSEIRGEVVGLALVVLTSDSITFRSNTSVDTIKDAMNKLTIFSDEKTDKTHHSMPGAMQ